MLDSVNSFSEKGLKFFENFDFWYWVPAYLVDFFPAPSQGPRGPAPRGFLFKDFVGGEFLVLEERPSGKARP